MPEMDGHAATRAIRALPPPVGTIPILAMSAGALPEEVRRCREAGMNSHIAKPVDRAVLLDAIDEAVPGAPAEAGAATVVPATPAAIPAAISAAAPIPLRQPLDRAMLRRILDEQGEDAFTRLAAAFLDDLPRRIDRLRAGGDPDRMLADARALIAPSANLGLVRLASACRALCASLRAGLGHEADGLLRSVADAAEEGAEALRGALPADPAAPRFKPLAKDIPRTS